MFNVRYQKKEVFTYIHSLTHLGTCISLLLFGLAFGIALPGFSWIWVPYCRISTIVLWRSRRFVCMRQASTSSGSEDSQGEVLVGTTNMFSSLCKLSAIFSTNCIPWRVIAWVVSILSIDSLSQWLRRCFKAAGMLKIIATAVKAAMSKTFILCAWILMLLNEGMNQSINTWMDGFLKQWTKMQASKNLLNEWKDGDAPTLRRVFRGSAKRRLSGAALFPKRQGSC